MGFREYLQIIREEKKKKKKKKEELLSNKTEITSMWTPFM